MKSPYRFKQVPEPNLPAAEEPVLPLILDRHRVYIFPTPFGFFFILVLFAMLLGSVNYNNNLGFLLVFLLGAMLLASIFHTYRNILGLRILSASAVPVFAGDPAVFSILVRAGKVMRRAVGIKFKNGPVTLENLAAAEDKRLSVITETRQRGMFLPGRLTVWSRFPLGLFHAWAHPDPRISCLVYPLPIPSGWMAGAGGAGDDSEGRGSADDFRGLRPYQPGDPVRRISWRTLSRGLGVFTKDFEIDSDAHMMFDFDHIKGDTEARLSGLCDLVLKAHGMNIVYGIKLPGQVIRANRGTLQKQTCLEALALFRS